MADELVFYTNPRSRGRIVRWMLEEVGRPYRTEVLDYGTTMKAPAYLALNPMGKVPAITHGDAVVTECAAICAYLADAFPKAKLAPPSGDRLRAPYYRWLFFTSGPVEAAVSHKALGFTVGQWQEREVQLRFRRDDLARRLKSLRATAHEAETLILKFTHITDYLSNEFHDLTNVLQSAQMESLVALQVLQMQEDERRVLAQRLHDGPMQSLAGTAMKAQLVPVVPEHAGIKEQVRQQLNAVIGDIRQIVFDLRPPLLDDLGLIPALKRYVQQWSEWNQLTVRTQLVGVEVMLRPTEKMTVFRVAQEVLQNIAQHAEATQVDIELTYGVDSLTVEIQDDGEGVKEVNWLTWINTGRLGLTMSRQRLSMLKGTLDLARTEPSGTKVTIGLPITRSEQNHVAGNHSDRHSG